MDVEVNSILTIWRILGIQRLLNYQRMSRIYSGCLRINLIPYSEPTHHLKHFKLPEQCMENLNPMDVLKEDLDTDQVAAKVNAIHKVRIVASILGVDGIRNILLPFLDQLIKKEEDQVLFAIADEIGNLATLLGNQHMIVVPYLENLCGQDETVVRDRAVKSIINLIVNATDAQINNTLVPLVLRLASNEGNFTCRVSAANIMCKLYPRAGANKEKLRVKFSQLSNEETPMVRRVIATKIGEMALVYEKQHIINDLITSFKQLSTDEQDLVRVLCLDSLKALAKVLSRDENKTHTLPVIIQSAEDKSWRVRLALSKNFSEIAQSFGKQITDLSLIQTFSTLLKDVENDVKIQATKSLSKFVKIVSPDKLSLLVPLILTLGKDVYPNVRTQITNVVGNIIASVPKDLVYQKLLPLVVELSKDQSQEVRQGALQAAARCGQTLGFEAINSILPVLKSGTEDVKWRVRFEAINAITSLCLSFKSNEFFLKYFETLLMAYIKDRAASVRDLGVQKIPELFLIYKDVWKKPLLAKLSDFLEKDNSYYVKICAIYSLKAVALCSNDVELAQITSPMIKALTSPVPNIRLIAAKSLRQIAKKYNSPSVTEEIQKAISTLSEDPDKDVKQFVEECKASWMMKQVYR